MQGCFFVSFLNKEWLLLPFENELLCSDSIQFVNGTPFCFHWKVERFSFKQEITVEWKGKGKKTRVKCLMKIKLDVHLLYIPTVYWFLFVHTKSKKIREKIVSKLVS